MHLFPPNIMTLSENILAAARGKGIRIVTAESCTAGLVAACLTEISGASHVFDRGFAAYSNDAKMAQLSVDRKTLHDFGAVSAETALEMAAGALSASLADLAVSITGISGPGGASEGKPLGLVYIATADRKAGNSRVIRHVFPGDRTAVRLSAAEAALKALLKDITDSRH